MKVNVELWSDIACPFCYIGEVRFVKAIAALHAEDLVSVKFRSFQLEKDCPSIGEPALMHYAGRMGLSEEDIRPELEKLETLATGDGLDFCYDRVIATNTFDAHRVVKYAASRGVSGAERRLFHAYFSEGLNVGDREVLALVAKALELDADDVRAVLDSDMFAAAVRSDEAEAAERRIRLVPHFLFGNGQSVSGAQSEAYFIDFLRKMLADQGPQSSDASRGTACGPDGCLLR